jgi:antitoxin CptB
MPKSNLLGGPDVRSRRLLFRCRHRGTQESDLILGSFAETSLARLDSIQPDRFEALLDCPDTDLFGCGGPGAQAPRNGQLAARSPDVAL